MTIASCYVEMIDSMKESSVMDDVDIICLLESTKCTYETKKSVFDGVTAYNYIATFTDGSKMVLECEFDTHICLYCYETFEGCKLGVY